MLGPSTSSREDAHQRVQVRFDEGMVLNILATTQIVDWAQGSCAKHTGSLCWTTMEPDRDGHVRLKYSDGATSTYVNIADLVPTTLQQWNTDQVMWVSIGTCISWAGL